MGAFLMLVMLFFHPYISAHSLLIPCDPVIWCFIHCFFPPDSLSAVMLPILPSCMLALFKKTCYTALNVRKDILLLKVVHSY